MTHFEYIFVAVSIVLSFTILRLLDALPTALNAASRYWVHTVWVLQFLFFCVNFWWLNWVNRSLDSISQRYFLFLIAAMGILYLTATSLVSATPTAVSSWRAHFFQHRRPFFAGAFVYLALLTFNSFVTFEIPLLHGIRAVQAFHLLLFALGFAMGSERAQARIAALIAASLGISVGGVLSGQSFQIELE